MPARRRVARKIETTDVSENVPVKEEIVQQPIIPDLLSNFTPVNIYPVNSSVQEFFCTLHRSSVSSTVPEVQKTTKTTRAVNKRKKKQDVDENNDEIEIPTELEFKNESGETITIEEIASAITESIESDNTSELKFVEIRSSKNNSKDKNVSKHDKIQDNTNKHILKPTLVQNKNLVSSVEARVVQRFDREQFINEHFVQSACVCNETVKNGKYYAFDIYGCIIRADCFNKNANPYGWILNENNQPVSIFAPANCIDKRACINVMKNKFTSAFGSKGMAYRMYRKCYPKMDI